MSSTPKYLVLGGVASAGLAALFQIVGAATTGWADMSLGIMGDFDLGLFKICIQGTCGDWGDAGYGSGKLDTLRAIRALVIIGLLGAIAGAALGVLTFLKQNDGKKWHLFALIALVFSDILPIIGVILFRTNFINGFSGGNGFFTFGYSCVLCIIGSVLGWVGGVLIFYGGRRMAA